MLRRGLWEKHRIEVPIVERPEGLLIRISTHFYNTEEEVDRLAEVLGPGTHCQARHSIIPSPVPSPPERAQPGMPPKDAGLRHADERYARQRDAQSEHGRAPDRPVADRDGSHPHDFGCPSPRARDAGPSVPDRSGSRAAAARTGSCRACGCKFIGQAAVLKSNGQSSIRCDSSPTYPIEWGFKDQTVEPG